MINANVVNAQHFPEQEMVRLFKGTCLAVRAMHEYRPTTPRSAVVNGKNAKNTGKSQKHGEEEDNDERFPQPEGDADGGYSYDGPSSVNVPLVTRHRVEDEGDGDVVFDGDDDEEQQQQDGPPLAVVPYAHRDLKPG